MTPRCKLLAAAVLVTAFATAAAADIPPAPGERERAMVAIIKAAGHTCDGHVTFSEADEDAARPYRARGLLDVYRVECAMGGRYLLALPYVGFGVRPARPDVNGKPIPFPPPEVKPLGR